MPEADRYEGVVKHSTKESRFMERSDFRRLTRRIYLIGVGTPVFLFHALATICVLFVFRFDGEMMLVYLYAALIATAIAVPPAVVILVSMTNRVRSGLVQAKGEGPRSAEAGSARYLKIIDNFPLSMALVAFVAALVAVMTEALFFYFVGDYNASLTFWFVILGLDFTLFVGYIEFFVQYRIMEPARKEAYASVGRTEYRKSMSLRYRVIALPTILTLAVLILGWVMAVTYSIINTQENMVERGRENATIIADRFAAEQEGAVYKIDEETVREFTLTADETLLIVDRRGQVLEKVTFGKELDETSVQGLLQSLQDGEEQALLGGRKEIIAAGAPIGGSGYTLVKVFPVSPFLKDVGSLSLIYLILALTFLAVAFALTKMTSDSIADPLERLETAANKVSDGDLTVAVQATSCDEIGMLSSSFSSMVSSLHQLSEQALHSAEDTSEGASGVSATTEEAQASLDQLSGIIQQLAENASREAKMADEVYSLATEIYDALEGSSSQADMGVEVSQTSSSLAEKGRRDALAAVERMGQVRDSITETAGIIKTLGEQSEEISIIVEVIDNIADQTNLLALNAAIEAARAQEQGRGFSVVAEEVRKLAEESTQSTNRIANLVREIQKNTVAAVEKANRGTEEVSAGMEAVQVAGESLERIYDFVKRAEELSSTIAETTRKHLQLGNQILEAMGEIRDIAEQNASSTEEISAASEEQSAAMQELSSTSVQLSSLADGMRGMVERYKL
jgi:methyl-accepting chemotaxis protein